MCLVIVRCFCVSAGVLRVVIAPIPTDRAIQAAIKAAIKASAPDFLRLPDFIDELFMDSHTPTPQTPAEHPTNPTDTNPTDLPLDVDALIEEIVLAQENQHRSRAIALTESLIAVYRRQRDAQESSDTDATDADLARALHILADLYDQAGQYGDAIQGITEAIQIRKQIHAASPTLYTAIDTARSYANLGIYVSKQGLLAESCAPFIEAIKLCQQFLSDHPEQSEQINVSFAVDLADILHNLGNAYLQIGNLTEAFTVTVEAIEVWRQLIQREQDAESVADPESGASVYFADLARSLGNLGLILHGLVGQSDTASDTAANPQGQQEQQEQNSQPRQIAEEAVSLYRMLYQQSVMQDLPNRDPVYFANLTVDFARSLYTLASDYTFPIGAVQDTLDLAAEALQALTRSPIWPAVLTAQAEAEEDAEDAEDSEDSEDSQDDLEDEQDAHETEYTEDTDGQDIPEWPIELMDTYTILCSALADVYTKAEQVEQARQAEGEPA